MELFCICSMYTMTIHAEQTQIPEHKPYWRSNPQMVSVVIQGDLVTLYHDTSHLKVPAKQPNSV